MHASPPVTQCVWSLTERNALKAPDLWHQGRRFLFQHASQGKVSALAQSGPKRHHDPLPFSPCLRAFSSAGTTSFSQAVGLKGPVYL